MGPAGCRRRRKDYVASLSSRHARGAFCKPARREIKRLYRHIDECQDGCRASWPGSLEVKSNIALETEEARKSDDVLWSQRERQFRIAMVGFSFYDGDNRVMRYAETLAARGDHVDVISLVRPGQSSREIVRGVNVFRVQGRVINERGKWDYFWRVLSFFFRSIFLLTRNHLKDRYDLVHIHSVPDFMVFTALVPKLLGTKVILDIHDVLPEFYASKFRTSHSSVVFKTLLWIERVSAAFADHVIISNDIWLKKFTARSSSPGKCSTLLYFPCPAIFRRNGRTPNDSKFIILYPGTLSWHQGLDIAIRAFHLGRNELTNAEFHIYATGSARDSLLQLFEELDLTDRVAIKESFPLPQFPRVMENADLGIVPKRKDRFGNEAFSKQTL